MNDIYKILEFTSKSHKQSVYILNNADEVKIKMVSPTVKDEIKYANGETGTISIKEALHVRTLKIGREITKEQYEDNDFS